jgi:hypothetical protein
MDKELSLLNPKNCYYALRSMCLGSEIWDSDRIPDPQHGIEATRPLDGR